MSGGVAFEECMRLLVSVLNDFWWCLMVAMDADLDDALCAFIRVLQVQLDLPPWCCWHLFGVRVEFLAAGAMSSATEMR